MQGQLSAQRDDLATANKAIARMEVSSQKHRCMISVASTDETGGS